MFRTLHFLSVIFITELYFVSYAQDINVHDSGILCDGIECPKGTKVCLVKKDSIPNTDQMTVERTCKSGDGSSFFSDVQTVPSPGSDYHFVSETSIDGSFSLNSNTIQISEGVKEDIQRQLIEQTKKLENEAKNVTRQVQDAVKKALDGLFNRKSFKFI